MKRSIEATQEREHRQEAPLITPTDLKPEATRDIAGAMNAILADVFALYLKTVGSSRVDLQACKLEYSIVSPK